MMDKSIECFHDKGGGVRRRRGNQTRNQPILLRSHRTNIENMGLHSSGESNYRGRIVNRSIVEICRDEESLNGVEFIDCMRYNFL